MIARVLGLSVGVTSATTQQFHHVACSGGCADPERPLRRQSGHCPLTELVGPTHLAGPEPVAVLIGCVYRNGNALHAKVNVRDPARRIDQARSFSVCDAGISKFTFSFSHLTCLCDCVILIDGTRAA